VLRVVAETRNNSADGARFEALALDRTTGLWQRLAQAVSCDHLGVALLQALAAQCRRAPSGSIARFHPAESKGSNAAFLPLDAQRPRPQDSAATITNDDTPPPPMPSPRTLAFLQKLRGNKPPEQRAHELIAAIDAGGLPLIPARVNDIARKLGLEVSVDAQMPETIERIRLALHRQTK